MPPTALYCEGNHNSFDRQILEKIVETLPNPIQIIPIKGKYAALKAIELAESAATFDKSIFFRDRDFDQDLRCAPIEALFQKSENDLTICYSYRTTIENYLLHPELFFEYLQTKNIAAKYKIHHSDDIKQLFIRAAQEIADYQAVRYALGKTGANMAFRTTWTSGSGKLPSSLLAVDCLQEGRNMALSAEHFQQEYVAFKSIFSRSDFFTELRFLAWFQGKDLATKLAQNLRRLRRVSLSIEGYYRFALRRFDYRQFPDLIELRALLAD